MRPHEEQQRRATDESTFYRVAFSPWMNVLHLTGTIAILIALVQLGGTMWGNQQATMETVKSHDAEIQAIANATANLSYEQSAQDQRILTNRHAIQRVESQAAEDRDRILKRLDRLSDQLDDLNKYLRQQRAEAVDHEGA